MGACARADCEASPHASPAARGCRRSPAASVTQEWAGHTAGLLGIGGGMIVSPLLLELGVHPLVAASTSSLMVWFSD